MTSLFRHLSDDYKRARLIALRQAVRPILANNLLPHFTAHDVEHCDRLTAVADALIHPVQATTARLNADELFVLYASAYLHDVGMHYERVPDSPTLTGPLAGRAWEDLAEDDRRDLLRRYHPAISRELVLASVRNATPPIGLQLVDDDRPEAIANLCEAHGLDTASTRYDDLTADGPALRSRLLAGVLRCADILEESRRRAGRARAESLLLPLESQVHWWRHYYTADITFDPSRHAVVVWFEFPSNRPELERIVPELQVPDVRSEFQRHQQVFAIAGISWLVETKISPHHTAEELPERVLQEMLLGLARRRQHEADERQRALAQGLDEARPQFERRLAELRRSESTLSANAIALRLQELALDMKTLGSRASARILLREAFAKAESADASVRVGIGIELVKVLLESRDFEEAARTCERLTPSVEALMLGDQSIQIFWQLKVDAELRAGLFEHCIHSIERLRAQPSVGTTALVGTVSELRFLSGSVFGTTSDGEQRP